MSSSLSTFDCIEPAVPIALRRPSAELAPARSDNWLDRFSRSVWISRFSDSRCSLFGSSSWASAGRPAWSTRPAQTNQARPTTDDCGFMVPPGSGQTCAEVEEPARISIASQETTRDQSDALEVVSQPESAGAVDRGRYLPGLPHAIPHRGAVG